ncbi:MAG: LemA family protein [Nanoarchaeota archaeon]|nr:LemA family protein [Nanoarchaeota archaeon]MBU1322197.1 LemA family protein [Nanoarchaeota archaeon]MBU1597738.1 LemA family protein [Nanoarchaeota archaeon]MBU2442002.1 LemA family protein [Nanoarchaeota archaeon]
MAKKKNLSTGAIVGIVVAVVVVIIVLSVIGMFNTLQKLDESVDNAWGQVETSYQRRADLIPNLMATVQGAADFEQETQTQVAALRSGAVAAKQAWDSATTPEEQVAAANQMEGVLAGFRSLNINVERYPELKATQNFETFQIQLEGTENRVSVERKRYNDAVAILNKKTRVFPSNIIASMSGIEKKTYFDAQEGAEVAPTVEFT